MNENLVPLKLMLDELDVSPGIVTVDDRKRVQKAVYLGQAAGVNLGYRYGWYLMGPYSPHLAKDYYQLDEELAANPDAFKDKRLRDATKLAELSPLLEPPEDWPLSQEDWLELLASYLYLRKESRQDAAKALATMKHYKQRLADYVPQAMRALRQYGLLAA